MQTIYNIAITAASLLVVLKLMAAGVQYMFTESAAKKGDAIKDIRGAIIGLLIILAAITLLNTINPALTNWNFLRNAEPATANVGGIGGTTSGQVNADILKNNPNVADVFKGKPGTTEYINWWLDCKQKLNGDAALTSGGEYQCRTK